MFLEAKNFYKNYDVGDTSFVYGRLGSPSGHPVQGKGGVETSGASTTVTAVADTVAAGINPFDPVNPGDVICFTIPPGDVLGSNRIIETVDTKTDGQEIDVLNAITLGSTAAFFFYPFKVGAALADGWHHVGAWSAITVYVRVNTLASTGIDVSVEGATGAPFSSAVQLAAPATIAAEGTVAINIDNVTPFLRVGLKADTTANAGDDVDVWAIGEMLQFAE